MREGLRRWATPLDVLVLVLAFLLLRSWLVPGYRITITPDIRLSLTSWHRLAIWLGLLLAVRYWVIGGEPFHARVRDWWRRLRASEPVSAAWGPFAVSRLMVLVVAYLAVVAIGFAAPPAFRPLDNGFLDLYARWDAGWYFAIASVGYPERFDPTQRSAIAFFPALPLLMRGTGRLLDVNLWAAGVIVVTAAFLFALIYVYRLARLDLDPDAARASLLFLSFYPFAICYSALLTESLFLLVAAAALFHFRRDQLWRAAAFGFFAGLLRPNGCLLSVPLGILALAGLPSGQWRRFLAQAAAASLPVAGMVAYSLYVESLVGQPFAWVAAQQAWGRRPAEILNILEARRELIASTDLATYVRSYPAEVIEGVTALLVLGTVWPIARRFGLAYAVIVATAVLPPLISMGPVSLGRYSAPLFPVFLWLGAAVPPAHRAYWTAVFAAGQALMAALFFTWRPPY